MQQKALRRAVEVLGILAYAEAAFVLGQTGLTCCVVPTAANGSLQLLRPTARSSTSTTLIRSSSHIGPVCS